MYSEDKVKQSCLRYFDGDEIATNKWMSKYCLKNKKGEYLELTPNDMHIRIAKEFERIEKKYPNPLSFLEIFSLLKDFKYLIPQGSPMYGIGNNYFTTSLSNCFVIGNNNNNDSYGSIMRTDEEQVQLMKRRGGVGHDISHLRPSGSFANNSILGSNAGSILYMHRFSNSTREVAQDGRRGALMLTIDVRHPDTENFVDSKLDSSKITGANISVKITNKFMKAVEEDLDFIQTFPIDLNISDHTPFIESLFNNEIVYDKLYNLEYDGYLEFKNCYAKRIKARKLWDRIIKNAHSSAEPGILFWDKVIEESPSDCYEGFETVSTNPCGEIPLCPYDSCRLLAVNLYSYVINPFTERSSFNIDLFRKHVHIAQRLMDDLVDLEIEKIDKIISKIKDDPESSDIKSVELNLWLKIREKAVNGRRTGLGITAEGDMLAALGLRYGTEMATTFSEEIHKVLAQESYISSIVMAKERGCFPIWDLKREENNPFINRVLCSLNETFGVEHGQENPIIWDYERYGRRNISNLTIAPVGSVSILSRTTSGIEPLFSISYIRRSKLSQDSKQYKFIDELGDKWEEYKIFHQPFIEWFRVQLQNKVNNFHSWYDEFDFSNLSISNFLSNLDDKLYQIIYSNCPYFKATSNDVNYFEKVRMQGNVQKWVDHSISVTVNMPSDVTEEIVSQCYSLAHKSGCKGMTVYRDGSRSGVLIKDSKSSSNELVYHDSVKRPEVVCCDIFRKTVLKKDWMIVVGLLKDKPIEIFAFEDVDNQTFPKNIQKGFVRKIKSKVYELFSYIGDKKYCLPDIVSLISIDEKSDTRKYSLMLRHGIHPKFIIEQIEEYATVVSFDKAIQRVLKNYINLNGLRKSNCPECGLQLMIVEGCEKCTCGYSRC